MHTISLQTLESQWLPLQPLLIIRNEYDYDQAIMLLNHLLDIIGNNETHPLYGLLDTLGTIIHAYEEVHYPITENHT